MQQINVRSDIPSSIIKMKKIMNDPDNTIVVAIVADWCGACQQFKPIWKSTVNTYLSMQRKKLNTKKLVLATVQDSTIQELNIGDIRGFPTICIIKNKTTLHEHLGGMGPEYLMEYIKNVSKRCKTIPNNKKNTKKSIKKSKKQKTKSKQKIRNKKTKKTKSKKQNKKSKQTKTNKKQKVTA